MSTPDTWDTDAYVTAGCSFSNGNRTVLCPASNAAVQTLEGKRSGKFYVEITCNFVGSSLAGVVLNNSCGAHPPGLFEGFGLLNTNTVLYRSDGNIYFHSELSPWGTAATWTTGDVIGLQFDFTTPQFSVNKNGGAWTQVTGAMAAAIGNGCHAYPLVGGPSAEFTINTGQIPFVYTVPAGFTGGWPNTTAGTYFGTFAPQDVGSDNPVTGNNVIVSPYVAPYTGTILKLVVAPIGVFDNLTAAGVVYDATGAGGTPGALLGSTTSVAGTAPAGEITFTFSSPISVTMGTTYYLGFLNGTTTGRFYWPWNGVSGSAGIGNYFVPSTFPTIPESIRKRHTGELQTPGHSLGRRRCAPLRRSLFLR